MQFYALDKEKKLVYASHAAKQKNYLCLECQSIVRLRSGPHRQSHFYHLTSDQACRQSAKSMAHIQTQLFLISLLPKEEAELEKQFPNINRIADVVWIPQKLVFEVQCSPITSAEVLARNNDYTSQGYQVIWILHDKRYNQWRLSAAEQALRSFPYYYTNMDADGNGIIYDQFDIFDKGFRKYILPPLTIAPQLPRRNHELPKGYKKTHSKAILERFHLPVGFSGDLVNASEEYVAKILQIEAKLENKAEKLSITQKIKKILFHAFVKPYRLIFQILLERACK